MAQITRREAMQQIARASVVPTLGCGLLAKTKEQHRKTGAAEDKTPVYAVFHGPWGLVFYSDHVLALAPPVDVADHYVSSGDYVSYVGFLNGKYSFDGTDPINGQPDEPDDTSSIVVSGKGLGLQVDPQSTARVSIRLNRPKHICALNYGEPGDAKNWLSGKHAEPINKVLKKMPETLLFEYEVTSRETLSFKPLGWKADPNGKIVELHFFISHVNLPGSKPDPNHLEEKHSFSMLRGMFPPLDLELALPYGPITTRRGDVPYGMDPDHIWSMERGVYRMADGTGANCGSAGTIINVR